MMMLIIAAIAIITIVQVDHRMGVAQHQVATLEGISNRSFDLNCWTFLYGIYKTLKMLIVIFYMDFFCLHSGVLSFFSRRETQPPPTPSSTTPLSSNADDDDDDRIAWRGGIGSSGKRLLFLYILP